MRRLARVVHAQLSQTMKAPLDEAVRGSAMKRTGASIKAVVQPRDD